MDEIPSGKPDPKSECYKLDLETHDRIDSVWLFSLFHAHCSLVFDPNSRTELGI